IFKMPSCENCGEEQFDEHDGLYFCSNCNTQSQDVREELQDEDVVMSTYNKSLAIASARERKKADLVDLGRPWSTHEGFLIILREQVKGLISKGLPSELKEIVFHLWKLYLSKLGVAFCSEDTENITMKFYPRHRDLEMGSIENPIVPATRWNETYKKNRKPVDRTSEMDQHKDKTNNETQVDSDNDSSSSEEGFVEEDRGYKTAYKSAERVTMNTTLALCFLGTQYASCLVTPSDIIRWCHDGSLLYLNAAQCFPEDMKLQNYDVRTFSKNVIPSGETLCRVVGRLAVYLGLDNFPPFDFHSLVSSYIIHLGLPGELHSLVWNMIRSHPPRTQYRPTKEQHCFPSYDILAMAYIVVQLKLLFGLNDVTESLLSELAEKVNQRLKGEQRLFVWRNWFSYIKQNKCRFFQKTDCNKSNKPNMAQMLNKLEAQADIKYSVVREKKQTDKRKENRAILQQQFYVSDDAVENTSENAAQDFSGHTLKFITEKSDFVNDLDGNGLSNYTLFTDSSSVSDSDSDDSDDDVVTCLSTPLKRRCIISSTISNRESNEAEKQHPTTKQLRKDINSILEKLDDATENYIVYEDDMEFHNSYESLLEIFCCYLGLKDISRLHSKVKEVENIYLTRKEELLKMKLRNSTLLKYRDFCLT
ncbi:unnamed protein product, partial [Owenia fusiformis]